MKLYYACALHNYDCASEHARLVELAGHKTVSRWHHIVATGTVDLYDPMKRREILIENLSDIEACDVIIVLAHVGNPRATFCEVGYALARGKQCIWVHSDSVESRNIFDAHPATIRIDVTKTTVPLAVAICRALDSQVRDARAMLETIPQETT